MKTLYLCGAGNSEGVRLACFINREQALWDRIVLLDDDVSKHGSSLLGVEIEGPIDRLKDLDGDSAEVANLVARTTAKRWSVRTRLAEYGLPFAPLVHPGIDTVGATLGGDIVAYHNATIGPEVAIDEGTVVFMGAIVGHECYVNKCTVIGSNAVLNARVRVEEGVYVGTNATVLPELTIGRWATIGAGSVVIQDVPEGATVMGVPAQIISEPQPSQLSAPEKEDDWSRAGSTTFSDSTVKKVLETIRRIWRDALRLAEVGDSDNFFDLGGTSLLALQVHGRIEHSIEKKFPLTDIFRFPTVGSLARHVAQINDGSRMQPAGRNRAAIRRGRMARNVHVQT